MNEPAREASLPEYIIMLGNPDHRAAQEYCDLIRKLTALESENKALREEALTDAENRRIVGIAADQIREDIRTGKRERMSLLGVQT